MDETHQLPSSFRIGDELRLYAVGDVHGRVDLLDDVLRKIDADLQMRPVRRALRIFLGDYIDRGRHSREVIDRLIELGDGCEVHCLKGNHEKVLVDYIRNPAAFQSWRPIGGLETLASYGLSCTLNPGEQEQHRLWTELRAALPARHLAFLGQLKPSLSIDDVFFVHAGVRPGVPLDAQQEMDLIWIRDEFLRYDGAFGKFIVHGHTPVRAPDVRTNRINIDTGAYVTGRLTCLWIEGACFGFL
ncbi:MAG: metallophosphoesterase family protein [Tardiphaga sp.]